MDPDQIKGRVLQKKLSKVLNMQEWFDSVKQFSKDDKALNLLAHKLTEKRKVRESREAFA